MRGSIVFMRLYRYVCFVPKCQVHALDVGEGRAGKHGWATTYDLEGSRTYRLNFLVFAPPTTTIATTFFSFSSRLAMPIVIV